MQNATADAPGAGLDKTDPLSRAAPSERVGFRDPLSAAVEEGISATGESRPARDVYKAALSLFEKAQRDADDEASLALLLDLVRQFPSEERIQILVARLFEARRHPEASAIWSGVLERFPDSHNLVVEAFRRVLRNLGTGRVRKLLAERFPQIPDSPARLLLYARVLDAIGDFHASADAIDRLLDLEKTGEEQFSAAANLYFQRGDFDRARAILGRALARHPGSQRIERELVAVEAASHRLTALLPVSAAPGGEPEQTLFERMLRSFAASRVEGRPAERLGAVVLLGRSLEAGGAERQMTNTAIAIQRAIAAGTSFDGVSLTGPVHVVCRSISARAETGFYLDELREQGVTVSQYANLAPQAGVRRGIVRRIEPLLEFLPPSVGEATRKLTDVLDTLSPQVAHIWQDGMIMATLLATLIARVPRIVLSLRTVPPIDRPERNLPDYHALYRTAADIPGVRLVANSHAAAKRFADWLAIAPDRIGVVHNGVEPPAPEGDSRARRAWEAFFAGAAPDAPVVGAVMRFDENKRPLQWVHAAQAILEHEPRARFVMIGDGPLRSSTQELAVRLGLADRILIPGNSRHVGFWLSKMSVLLLLSRHEGLPNALIEAQLAGVPVVATAAGGAAETFADRLTGTLLPGGEELDIELVVQAVRKWIVDPQTRGDIHRRCVDYAAPRFSMQSMIDATVRAYR